MSQELPRSLHPLALLAAREAGADGFAIHQIHAEGGRRELKLEWGVPAPEAGETGLTVISFSLHAGDEVTGVLTFVFRGAASPPRARPVLDRIAPVIEGVWRLSLLPAEYARNAARIGELETELADSKIADRARGMLASGAPARDAVDTIVRHVESVLRPGQLATVLKQLTQEVEQEISERELASRAKAVLQSRYGMSEDQAHVHLRLVSRKSRKRLRDVAWDVLQEPLAQRGR
jgi:ANTAR domain